MCSRGSFAPLESLVPAVGLGHVGHALGAMALRKG
jgi:hypothetical protein